MIWPLLTMELKSTIEVLDGAGDLRADLHRPQRLERAGRLTTSVMSPCEIVVCTICRLLLVLPYVVVVVGAAAGDGQENENRYQLFHDRF